MVTVLRTGISRLTGRWKWQRRLLRLSPIIRHILIPSGGCISVLDDYKHAEQYVKKAIDKGEVSPVVHEHLGDIYYKMKDVERAMEEWKIALKMDESNVALQEKIARGSL